MRGDLTQEILLPKLQVLVYLLCAVAMAFLVYDQYRHGAYSLVLTCVIAVPVFLFGALFIYLKLDNGDFSRVHYTLIVVLCGLGFYQLAASPDLMTHYFFIFPLLSFFVLPIASAVAINVVLVIGIVSVLWQVEGIMDSIRAGINYVFLFVSAWCFAYLTFLKSWSLRQQALTDPYSNAYNRKHFFHALEREIQRSNVSHKSVSVIGLLIDEYSQILDMYGQHEIVQLLPKLVEKTQKLIRTGDDIFRLNDDLFVLLLPNCTEDGAILLMDRIKKNLQEQNWNPIADLSFRTVALSASSHDDGRELEQRLQARLHKQKRTSLQIRAFAE